MIAGITGHDLINCQTRADGRRLGSSSGIDAVARSADAIFSYTES